MVCNLVSVNGHWFFTETCVISRTLDFEIKDSDSATKWQMDYMAHYAVHYIVSTEGTLKEPKFLLLCIF